MNNNPLVGLEIPDPVLENPNLIPEGMPFEDFVNQQLASAAIEGYVRHRIDGLESQ